MDIKEKIDIKIKNLKKFLFLALVSYLYDIVANRMKKKKDANKFVDNVEYKIKDENDKE